MKGKKLTIIIAVVILLAFALLWLQLALVAYAEVDDTPYPPLVFPPATDSPSDDPVDVTDIVETIPPRPPLYSPPYSGSISFRQYSVQHVNGTPGSIFYGWPSGGVGATPPNFAVYQWTTNNMTVGDPVDKKNSLFTAGNGYYIYQLQSTFREQQPEDGNVVQWYFRIPNLDFDALNVNIGNYNYGWEVDLVGTVNFIDGRSETFTQTVLADTLKKGLTYNTPINSTARSATLDIIIRINVTPLVGTTDYDKDAYKVFLEGASPIIHEDIVRSDQVVQEDRFLNKLFDGIMSLFVPNSDMLQVFLEECSEGFEGRGGGIVYVKSLFLRILKYFSSGVTPPAPKITIPRGSLDLNSQFFTFFNGYVFDFADIPPTLISYIKTCTNVLIVGGFVSYLWHLLVQFFGLVRSGGKDVVEDYIESKSSEE